MASEDSLICADCGRDFCECVCNGKTVILDDSDTIGRPQTGPAELTRSLSHGDRAIQEAEDLIATLAVGDSMLINWWHDDDYVDYTVLFKTEQGIRTRDYHCTVAEFHRHWTHAAVRLPPHLVGK